MRDRKNIKPPVLADKLLEWYCGNAFMEDLRGDLDESFACDLDQGSRARARRRYWRQAFSLIFSYAVIKRKRQASFHAFSYTSFSPDMIKNYFLISFRNLMKSRLYILINIFGLAIAASCCVIAYLNYHFNADFDTNHSSASVIYRVSSQREFEGERETHGTVPLALAQLARETMPAISRATRYDHSSVSLKIGDDLFNGDIRYVDADFFLMFDFEFIHGSAPGPDDRTRLVISDRLALKLFGTVDAVGNTVSQFIEGRELKPFEISGVYKLPPPNSSFVDDGYALFPNLFDEDPSIDEHSWKHPTTLFVRVDDIAEASRVEADLSRQVDNDNMARGDQTMKRFMMDPFQGMAVRDMENLTRGLWTRPAISKASVNGCVIMAALVLLLACVNLTNTTLATTSRRLKEIGIRKVMGSYKRQVVMQFMGETGMVCTIALLAGLWMTWSFLLPAYNALWPYMELETNYFGPNSPLPAMAMVLGIMVLVAGAYPAIYVSRFEPIQILKGTFTFEGMTGLSLVLLSLQFVISLIGIISAVAFVQNARYQQSLDLGFAPGLVFAQVRDGKETEALMAAVMQNPRVLSAAGSRQVIGWGIPKTTVKSGTTKIEAETMEIGDHYLQTAGMTLVAGRDFIRDSNTDKKESVIVSEAFVKSMGWHDALGQKVVVRDTTALYVVGVVKNIYSRGLWRKVEPTMFRYVDNELCSYVTVRPGEDDMVAVYADMEDKWKQLFPNRLYNGQYANAAVVEAVQVNDNLVKMFAFVGMVAVLLSGTGLFTLVSLTIVKRYKEIGIRKVLGASTFSIVRILNVRFIVIMIVSSILGSLFAMLAIEGIMGGIWATYLLPDMLTIGTGVAGLFAISFATIATRIRAAVGMNPVDSLRTE